ncbi:MAG: DUF2851 family protein [Candidatus Symbiothrix sp.]|jgi:hypothetical protein|nr:DUF2851 family protein [Candidatus Symbiothrix sp.]
METLLHYVWKYRLFDSEQALTTDGTSLEIIDPGTSNTDAGPDFFNAKIKLNGKLWAGNVEIHTAANDWYRHRHDRNKAYNSVILHVVEQAEETAVADESGRVIPQWQMPVPQHVRDNYAYLLQRDQPISCLPRAHEISAIYWNDWKNALTVERLERKTQTIVQLLQEHQNDWNEVFYITLARNFGFGINNDAFERLAKSLPLKYIRKHANNQAQVEALFLGQAGLLDETDIEDEYYLILQREYQFLSQKYGLQPLDASIFRSLRIRPGNFPHIKLVQLAGFIGNQQSIFSKILKVSGVHDLQQLFFSNVSAYWETHYHFHKSSVARKKGLSMSAINIILINTVAPILFAYGKCKEQESRLQQALSLLENLPAEQNHIITSFSKYGVKAENAADSQALIQLKTKYCDLKKCIYCRIGHRLLKMA